MSYEEHEVDPDVAKVETLVNRFNMKEDKIFIFEQLRRFPTTQWMSLMKEYISHGIAARDEEPNDNKKENAARYRANIWLLTK